MDDDQLVSLERNHPAWRLLGADHGPMIASFFASQLHDHLYHLHASTGEVLFPKPATAYLDDPLALIEQADGWDRILAIPHWFCAHPRPGLYLRQLDIPGVDTKFIEARKALLAELLDQVLPPERVAADALGARQFEHRYGLLGKPPMLRFRMLDPALHIGGLHDLTVPLDQFMALAPPATRVYVTEHEINMLAFPQLAGAMAIFGGGMRSTVCATSRGCKHAS